MIRGVRPASRDLALRQRVASVLNGRFTFGQGPRGRQACPPRVTRMCHRDGKASASLCVGTQSILTRRSLLGPRSGFPPTVVPSRALYRAVNDCRPERDARPCPLRLVRRSCVRSPQEAPAHRFRFQPAFRFLALEIHFILHPPAHAQRLHPPKAGRGGVVQVCDRPSQIFGSELCYSHVRTPSGLDRLRRPYRSET